MLKLVLSFTMLFSNYIISNISKVEKIEYKANDYEDNLLRVNIVISCSKRDVIELKVKFYDKSNKEMNSDYSSSLIIEGSKSTIAKIPIVIEDYMYMNMVIHSSNMDDDIVNVRLPLYPFKGQSCNLSKEFYCKSEYPSVITYSGENFIEKYEKISLVNKELKVYSYNNLLPLNKISLISNLEVLGGYASLYIKDKIEGFDIYYNEEYLFPLDAKCEDNVISFSLANNYYIDRINGKSYENFNNDGIYRNDIVFPYIDADYEMSIEIIDAFISFDNVVLDFSVYTKGNLIGDCISSKYCFRRIYI